MGGTINQVDAGPCDVFHMDARKHMVGFVDGADFTPSDRLEWRASRSVDAWESKNLHRQIAG